MGKCRWSVLSNPEKGKRRRKERKKALSRRDRSPCPRRTPPSLWSYVSFRAGLARGICQNVPSSFFSSSAGAAASPPAAAGAPPAPAAAGAPPEPTFRSRSLTSLPSRACPRIRYRLRVPIQSFARTLAKSVVQMGSTSSIFAALMRDWSLSA